MEVSSVQQLCKHLIFCSIQRCRLSDELCRLSIVLKPDLQSAPPLLRISVSDTGSGSQLEEFHNLRLSSDPVLLGKWDGVISITTTSISDNEIHHFRLDLKEKGTAKRFSKISSVTKYGAKFSGTEVSLSVVDDVGDILPDITLFVQKMSVLKIPKVVVEVLVDDPQTVPSSQCKSRVLANECCPLSSSAANIEHLKLGFEEYILKHGNKRNNICPACLPTVEHLKIGTGKASLSGSSPSSLQTMEAVVIIIDVSETFSPSCCCTCDTKTEVVFLKDFTPCAITPPVLDGLANIKWKDYGLTLKRISDCVDCIFLEWESLPPSLHIFISLHCYHENKVRIVPAAGTRQADLTLTKKALNSALNDLKEKNNGALLSAHALKLQDYAPDLAKTISGLILSSNDHYFKEECFSLLGLQSETAEEHLVEDCIKERITFAIGMNDQKQKRNREPAALLFEDYSFKSDYLEEEYEEDLEDFSMQYDFEA